MGGMSLRITYVVHQFLPRYFTGTEQYTFAIARGMQALGHDVEVYSLEPDFSERAPHYEEWSEEVEGLPVRRFRYWMHLGRDFSRMEYHHPFAGQRFGEYLRGRNPDVVHALHLRHLGANLLDEARLLGVPTVVHLMDFWFLCPRVTLLREDGSLCDGPPRDGLGCVPCAAPELVPELEASGAADRVRALHAERRATADGKLSEADPSPLGRATSLVERPSYLARQLRRADRVIAPSHFLRDTFLANGIDADSIEVITYGVDRARLTGTTPRPPRPADAPLRIGYFGSVAHYKGVDLLIDAVLATPGDLTLDIYGRLTDFPTFAEPLAERARNDGRIQFREPFPRDQLGKTLATIDVLVVPSRWYENTPFVILEAFAAGIPVIATNLGGMSELVTDGTNGDLFTPDSSHDLATKLQRLASDPQRLHTYTTNIPPIKSMDTNLQELAALYRTTNSG